MARFIFFVSCCVIVATAIARIAFGRDVSLVIPVIALLGGIVAWLYISRDGQRRG